MNNNFMGFFDPLTGNMNVGPSSFPQGPSNQQGIFHNMPVSMGLLTGNNGGMMNPNFQQHQRLSHYTTLPGTDALSPRGLGPGPPGLHVGHAPGHNIGSTGFSRLRHYRPSQHVQNPLNQLGSVHGMDAMNGPNLYGMRMQNLTPKDPMAGLDSRLGGNQFGMNINRWPRMPNANPMPRMQVPHLSMPQGMSSSMPTLQKMEDFSLSSLPSFPDPDPRPMTMHQKLHADEPPNIAGLRTQTQPLSDFNFGSPSSLSARNMFPNLERSMQPNQSYKQNSVNPLSLQQDVPMSMSMSMPLSLAASFVSQQQSNLPFGGMQPSKSSFRDPPMTNKFSSQIPQSPKLTHFGPTPTDNFFDQPMTQQPQSPRFPSFSDTLNNSLVPSQPMGMGGISSRMPVPSPSSSLGAHSPMELHSPTNIKPPMPGPMQIRQRVPQLQESPMQPNSPQVMKQPLQQYINQPRQPDLSFKQPAQQVPISKEDMSFLDDIFNLSKLEDEQAESQPMMELSTSRNQRTPFTPSQDPISQELNMFDFLPSSTPGSLPSLSSPLPSLQSTIRGPIPLPESSVSSPLSMPLQIPNMQPSVPASIPRSPTYPMAMPLSTPRLSVENRQGPVPYQMPVPAPKPSAKGKGKGGAKPAGGGKPISGSKGKPGRKKKIAGRKSSDSDGFASPPRTPVTPALSTASTGGLSSVESGNLGVIEENNIDSVITRRSLRERTKKNYKDDFEYDLSDDDESKKHSSVPVIDGHKLIPYKPSEAVEGEIAIIERILATRKRTSTNVNAEDGKPIQVEEEEFCVKYKGYSYLHCEWGTEKELMKKDKRAPMKIKRFKSKRDPVAFLSELDDDPFNPDFVEVDRVLDISTCIDHITGNPVTHYLVKWGASPYEESTWELGMNVDEPKIEQYLNLKKPPPQELQQFTPRPQGAFQWKKIDKSPGYKDGHVVRDYQLEGLNWLTFCWYKRQNCILADEMGLGKTIQSIAFLSEVKRYGIRGPFLVIAPLSTIGNWEREFESWTNINAIVYHGSAASRQLIQQYEMYYHNEKGDKILGIYKFEAVITTYEMILSENNLLGSIPWRCVIIDEAHRLKNRNCKLLEGLNNLKMEHRVLLTGTPLQNNVEELFSLLNFLEPSRFPSETAFLVEFGDLKTEAQVEKLQQILKPMMLRRLKEDVEKNIAPKEETIIEVELTTIQKKFYRAILEKNFTFLSKGATSSSNMPNLMNAMMELRKCCNHPFLINGAEERIVTEYIGDSEGIDVLNKHYRAMIESSGKMVLIDKLLPKLQNGGHKVLIFSQMIRVLDLLEEYLLSKRYLFERIDGRVRGNLRQAAIDRFSRVDSDRFAFLLCTRAGGLGINLTAADTVIIFDSDWNPQNDLQAQARCHRIGQEKSVQVYRLICRDTYEREMFDRASLKLGLDKAVLQNMNAKENGGGTTGPAMSKKEIEDLLKKGAYGALMNEDNDTSRKFCEEDIDQILMRRTQVIKIVGEGKGSTFAKASFVSDKARIDVDLDDPDFWTKWAQKASIDVSELQENLIIDKPRERKQTKRFGNEDGTFDLSDLESDEEEGGAGCAGVSGGLSRTTLTRVECFKVEKNLLIYGWGRWKDIFLHGHFKIQINETGIEAIARTILVYCLHFYKGDEKVKAFVGNLIKVSAAKGKLSSEKDDDVSYDPTTKLKFKKSKRAKLDKKGQCSKVALIEAGIDWQKVDPDNFIIDPGYRKHLQHHCNKLVSRVRLLCCLEQEIIGSSLEKIAAGAVADDITLTIPGTDRGESPASWWDEECDKSLLIGVYKHGYERYHAIRSDPCLCFAAKLGISPTDEAAPPSPDSVSFYRNEDSNDPDFMSPKKKRRKRESPCEDDDENSDEEDFDNFKDGDDDRESTGLIGSPFSTTSSTVAGEARRYGDADLKWPFPAELNTRLRRLVVGYFRGFEKEGIKMMKAEKVRERKEKIAQQVREKQHKKEKMAQKWTRREESDFYRVISTFGVVFDIKKDDFDWTKFRQLARLDKKDDDRVKSYYAEFMAMCRRVCGRPTEEDQQANTGSGVESISEERANRCLQRVKLLRIIREEVLPHEKMHERIKLCQKSPEFPVWWEEGKHDKELLIGVAKHGVGRTDYHLFTDPELCFKSMIDKACAGDSLKLQNAGLKENAKHTLSEFTPLTSIPIPESTTSSIQIPASTASTTSTASDSQTTESDKTSSESDSNRQPVTPLNDKGLIDDNQDTKSPFFPNMITDEAAEILSTWPKDRIILNRLEKMCHCVLNGSWLSGRSENINARVNPQVHQNLPMRLPSSLDRSDLLRQPSAGTGDDVGIRGEKAEGVAMEDKNFRVTSRDGLKITVKKRRRRTKKEIEEEAQVRQAQLNAALEEGIPLEQLMKPKRGRRKRKVENVNMDGFNLDMKDQILKVNDEPPLKITPHPIKLTSLESFQNTGELKETVKPPIILHVPANIGHMPHLTGTGGRTSIVATNIVSPHVRDAKDSLSALHALIASGPTSTLSDMLTRLTSPPPIMSKDTKTYNEFVSYKETHVPSTSLFKDRSVTNETANTSFSAISTNSITTLGNTHFSYTSSSVSSPITTSAIGPCHSKSLSTSIILTPVSKYSLSTTSVISSSVLRSTAAHLTTTSTTATTTITTTTTAATTTAPKLNPTVPVLTSLPAKVNAGVISHTSIITTITSPGDKKAPITSPTIPIAKTKNTVTSFAVQSRTSVISPPSHVSNVVHSGVSNVVDVNKATSVITPLSVVTSVLSSQAQVPQVTMLLRGSSNPAVTSSTINKTPIVSSTVAPKASPKQISSATTNTSIGNSKVTLPVTNMPKCSPKLTETTTASSRGSPILTATSNRGSPILTATSNRGSPILTATSNRGSPQTVTASTTIQRGNSKVISTSTNMERGNPKEVSTAATLSRRNPNMITASTPMMSRGSPKMATATPDIPRENQKVVAPPPVTTVSKANPKVTIPVAKGSTQVTALVSRGSPKAIVTVPGGSLKATTSVSRRNTKVITPVSRGSPKLATAAPTLCREDEKVITPTTTVSKGTQKATSSMSRRSPKVTTPTPELSKINQKLVTASAATSKGSQRVPSGAISSSKVSQKIVTTTNVSKMNTKIDTGTSNPLREISKVVAKTTGISKDSLKHTVRPTIIPAGDSKMTITESITLSGNLHLTPDTATKTVAPISKSTSNCGAKDVSKALPATTLTTKGGPVITNIASPKGNAKVLLVTNVSKITPKLTSTNFSTVASLKGTTTVSKAVSPSSKGSIKSTSANTKSTPVNTKSTPVNTKSTPVNTKSTPVNTKSILTNTKLTPTNTKSIPTKSTSEPTKSTPATSAPMIHVTKISVAVASGTSSSTVVTTDESINAAIHALRSRLISTPAVAVVSKTKVVSSSSASSRPKVQASTTTLKTRTSVTSTTAKSRGKSSTMTRSKTRSPRTSVTSTASTPVDTQTTVNSTVSTVSTPATTTTVQSVKSLANITTGQSIRPVTSTNTVQSVKSLAIINTGQSTGPVTSRTAVTSVSVVISSATLMTGNISISNSNIPETVSVTTTGVSVSPRSTGVSVSPRSTGLEKKDVSLHIDRESLDLTNIIDIRKMQDNVSSCGLSKHNEGGASNSKGLTSSERPIRSNKKSLASIVRDLAAAKEKSAANNKSIDKTDSNADLKLKDTILMSTTSKQNSR